MNKTKIQYLTYLMVALYTKCLNIQPVRLIISSLLNKVISLTLASARVNKAEEKTDGLETALDIASGALEGSWGVVKELEEAVKKHKFYEYGDLPLDVELIYYNDLELYKVLEKVKK